jgi:hypothetical protein
VVCAGRPSRSRVETSYSEALNLQDVQPKCSAGDLACASLSLPHGERECKQRQIEVKVNRVGLETLVIRVLTKRADPAYIAMATKASDLESETACCC